MSGWPIYKLGDYVFEQRQRLGSSTPTVYSVTNGRGFVPSLDRFDKQVFSKDIASYKFVACNDLAYNPSRINVGSIAICHDLDGGAVSPMYVTFRCKQGLLAQYLLYFLKSKLGLREIERRTEGTVRFQLKFRDLCSIELPVPPLAEQERIVKVLDEADAIRKLRAQADQRTADLLPALFHEMFGDPITNPMGWPIHALGAVLERIDSGWSPPCEDRFAEPDEWGVLKLGSVTSCQFIDIQNKALPSDRIPRPEIEESSGDLLFSRKNTSELVAACAYVFATRSRLMLSDLLFRLRIHPDAGIDPLFLWALLTNPSKRKELQRLASGSASSMPNISKSRLSTALILIPPLSLQQKFTERVGTIRSLRVTQQTVSVASAAGFDALLDQAFAENLQNVGSR